MREELKDFVQEGQVERWLEINGYRKNTPEFALEVERWASWFNSVPADIPDEIEEDVDLTP
jgi:hypothetical protein